MMSVVMAAAWTYGTGLLLFLFSHFLNCCRIHRRQSSSRRDQRSRCIIDDHFYSDLWMSQTLAFVLACFKEVSLATLNYLDVRLFGRTDPYPCDFRLILIYYESIVMAIVTILTVAGIRVWINRALLRRTVHDDQYPCDETETESNDEVLSA